MRLAVVAAVFPLVFLAELPDKTMFASLVMGARGRPLAVWLGAAAAFSVHVVIAVSVGVAVLDLLPHRAVAYLVAGLFLAGAAYSYLIRGKQDHVGDGVASPRRVALSAAGVIFVAEWGDLTQLITADLAARYHSWLSVGVGSLAAVLVVAGLAVLSGSRLLRRLPVPALRVATAAVLLAVGAYSLFRAAQG